MHCSRHYHVRSVQPTSRGRTRLARRHPLSKVDFSLATMGCGASKAVHTAPHVVKPSEDIPEVKQTLPNGNTDIQGEATSEVCPLWLVLHKQQMTTVSAGHQERTHHPEVGPQAPSLPTLPQCACQPVIPSHRVADVVAGNELGHLPEHRVPPRGLGTSSPNLSVLTSHQAQQMSMAKFFNKFGQHAAELNDLLQATSMKSKSATVHVPQRVSSVRSVGEVSSWYEHCLCINNTGSCL